MKSVLILFGILGIVTASKAAEPTSQGSLKPGLQITIEPLSKPNTFHLWAVNRGTSNVLVVRPRSGMVDRFGNWGGWSVRIEGTEGPFIPLPVPSAIPPFTSLDLTELRPGESIGVIFNLDHYANNRQIALAEMPGKYAIVASYYLDQDKVPGEPSENFITVPRLQPIESEPLQVVVQKD